MEYIGYVLFPPYGAYQLGQYIGTNQTAQNVVTSLVVPLGAPTLALETLQAQITDQESEPENEGISTKGILVLLGISAVVILAMRK